MAAQLCRCAHAESWGVDPRRCCSLHVLCTSAACTPAAPINDELMGLLVEPHCSTACHHLQP